MHLCVCIFNVYTCIHVYVEGMFDGTACGGMYRVRKGRPVSHLGVLRENNLGNSVRLESRW